MTTSRSASVRSQSPRPRRTGTRLSIESTSRSTRWSRSVTGSCLIVTLLTACTASTTSSPSSSSSSSPSPHAATTAVSPAIAMTWPVPIDAYTPGAVTTGCTYPRSTTERVVTSATKATVTAEYQYTGPTGIANLEYDHRVPFALCGDNGTHNVWPEPYDGVTQSTYVHNRKDQLESYAAREVRYGKWTLPFAQAVFRGDWRVAWCKYLHYAGVTCP